MAYKLSGVMDTVEVSCETVFKTDHTILAVNLNMDASMEAQLYGICPLQTSAAFNAHVSFGFSPYACIRFYFYSIIKFTNINNKFCKMC